MKLQRMCLVLFLCSCFITGFTGTIFADQRFEVLADSTVKDHMTGLMWAASDNGTNINWSSAVAYCEAYTGGGYTDWRTPTGSELATLYGNTKKIAGQDYEEAIDVITDAIKVSGPWVWTVERTAKNKAFAFGFNYGTTRRLHRGSGGGRRALPVRSMP